MKKLILGIVATFVIGYVFASPYITAYMIKTAAQNQDGEALSEYIDFSALRQNLKEQMNAAVGKEIMQEAEGDGAAMVLGATFGGLIIGKMVEKMIDVYVTPAGIMELMKGEILDMEGIGTSTEQQTTSEPFANVVMTYESFNKFSITTKDTESADEIKFILRRKGMEWKLTEILVPL